jgi:hypothetical protein
MPIAMGASFGVSAARRSDDGRVVRVGVRVDRTCVSARTIVFWHE